MAAFPGCSTPDRFECMLEQHSPSVQFAYAYISGSPFSLHQSTRRGDGCIPNETLPQGKLTPRERGISHSLNTKRELALSTTKSSSTMPQFLFLPFTRRGEHFTSDNSFMIPAFIHPFLTCLFQFLLP